VQKRQLLSRGLWKNKKEEKKVMKIKQVLAAFLTLAVTISPLQTFAADETTSDTRYLNIPVETTLAKSELGNPFLGFDGDGNILYGGDPSILVDGDTVYAYVGHDTSEVEWYQMPDYRAYSSKDLIHWKYENMILDMTQVSWALDRVTAWASQVIKFKGKYYLLFCTPTNISGEKEGHCIGVAECDTPTGNFVALDTPLIYNSQTGFDEPWYDIDPTAWVDKDENGNDETLYIGWGNTHAYVCQADVNEDGHLYVIDQNDNGIVSKEDGDIVQFTFNGNPNDAGFTEASYFYRQQDENGNYYGDYYVFYAAGWREQMAYSTTDDLMSGQLEFGGIVMPPSTTANTNHPAVFDYQGKSYFVYHTGALPWGSGFRRSACIDEFTVKEDGSIDPILMTSTGLAGVTTQIFDSEGAAIAHEAYENPLTDSDYPMTKKVMVDASAKVDDAKWELEKGKVNPENEAYVSIQSYNKPGLYLCADGTDIVLTQDYKRNDEETRKNMTFRTLEGFAGSGVTFESAAMPGYYLVSQDGDLKLSKTPSKEECSFQVKTDAAAVSLDVMKTKRLYTVGSELKTDDIRATVSYENGDTARVTDFTTNADSIDMNKVGKKELKVTYKDGENKIETVVPIRVVEKSKTASSEKQNQQSVQLSAYEQKASADNGPVKEYSFENDLNGADLRTLHNDGSYNGAAVYEEGKYGKALRLGDYGIKLNTGIIGQEYTVSMWVKPSQPVPNNGSLIYLGAPKGANELWTSLAGDGTGGLKLWATGDGHAWTTAFSGISLPTDEWSFVTLKQVGNLVVLYVNGEEKASGSAARPLMESANDIYIGVNHWDPLYQGLVDEVAVYDEALSEEEIAALYGTRDPEAVFDKLGFAIDEDVVTYTGVSSRLQVKLPAGVSSKAAGITYTSDTAEVAEVSENGIITAKKKGTAIITTKVTVGSVTKTAETKITVQDKEELEKLPVAAQYDMDAAEGAVIPDVSGKGNNAAIVNPDGISCVNDGGRTVLNITGTDSYLTLPSDIYSSLTDKEAFTIEATYARTQQNANTAWLFCFGSKAESVGKNYLFYAPFFGNGIRAGIKDDRTEHIYNSNSSLEAERYYTVDMVFDHGTVSLYIDGVLAGPALLSGMDMETIVKNGTADGILGYIGKSCWSSDPNFQGKIDSFKVYDKALTAGEVQISNPENQKKLEERLNEALNENVIIGENNTSVDAISCDMNLVPALDGMDIGWVSSDPEVIAADGSVTNPEKDAKVTLTAYLSHGLMTAEKTFEVTVKPMNLDELEAMLKEAKELDDTVFEKDSTAALTELMESLGENPLEGITSQQNAEDVKDALQLAVSRLVYLNIYKEPWDMIDEIKPKEDAAYQAGNTEVLFELPEELKNCVTVTYSSDNEEVAVYKDGKAEAVADGTAILTVTVTAKKDGFPMEYSTCVQVGENAGKLPYVDVKEGDWYYDAVAYNYFAKTMTGLDKTHFAPADTLVRGQFAAVLHKMNGMPVMEYTERFSDVTEPDWFKDAVLWAAEKKIVTGYTGTDLFGANDPVTRAQMATMMYRYAKDYKGYDVNVDGDYSSFPDAGDVQVFAIDAMKWAVSEGIITGKTINGQLLLDPQGSANRAECATIIQRFLEKYN